MGWLQRLGLGTQEPRSPATRRPDPLADLGPLTESTVPPAVAAGPQNGSPAGSPPPPDLPAAVDPNRRPAPARFEIDNLGLRVTRLEQAENYYRWRTNGWQAPGFLIYHFSREIDALASLLALDWFHMAEDTGNLICTLPLVFGWYRRADGLWEVLLGGPPLTAGQWTSARRSIENAGGRLVDQRRPPSEDAAFDSTDPGGTVRFVREYTEVALTETRRFLVFSASSAAAARLFLKQKESLPSHRSEVVRVETPEGVFCRDHTGLIEESDT
jgi:hypothetical protein